MEEWKEYKIKDITSILGDGLHGTPKYDENGDVFFINGNNLEDGDIIIKKDTKRVSIDEAQKYIKPLNDRTILVSINGTIGNVAKYNGESCILGKSACYFNVNPDVDIDFVYYVVANSVFKNTITQLATGTTIKNVSLETMRNYSFRMPEIISQRKISSILRSIDSKIKLNKRINDNLEQQIQVIFNHYFTNEPYDCLLGDVVKTTSGGTPSRKIEDIYYNGSIPWVKSKELNGTFLFDTEEHITELGVNNSSAKLLPKNSVLIAMYGATVGEYAIISKTMCCNQAVCALIPNDKIPYSYLLMIAKNRKYELINMAVGSAQQNISQVLVKNLPISSNYEIIANFNNATMSIFKEIKNNSSEIVKLMSIRDLLLPKLMSGELKINEMNN